MSFGIKLRNLRKERRLNQGDMAKALNISQQMISVYESGTSIPDAEMLLKIATYFGVSIDYLAGNVAETDDQLIIQSYKNLPPDKKNIAKEMIKLLGKSEGENE